MVPASLLAWYVNVDDDVEDDIDVEGVIGDDVNVDDDVTLMTSLRTMAMPTRIWRPVSREMIPQTERGRHTLGGAIVNSLCFHLIPVGSQIIKMI